MVIINPDNFGVSGSGDLRTRMEPLLANLRNSAQLCVRAIRIIDYQPVPHQGERTGRRRREAKTNPRETEWFEIKFAQNLGRLGTVLCENESEARALADSINAQIAKVLASERRKCVRMMRDRAPQLDAKRRDFGSLLDDIEQATSILSDIDGFRVITSSSHAPGGHLEWVVSINPNCRVVLKGSEQERMTIEEAMNAILVPLVDRSVQQTRDALVKLLNAFEPVDA